MDTLYQAFDFAAALCTGIILIAVFFTAPSYFKRVSRGLGLVTLMGATLARGEGTNSALASASPAPVVLADSQQFDFTSPINGRSYRVFVAVPPGFDAQKSYPVLYVLDGNFYFAAARDTLHYLARDRKPALTSGIIVGIGYPTDTAEAIRRRSLDLTPTKSSSASTTTGRGDEFVRVLTEEIKPFVASRYKIDPEQQAIFGKSLGGLTVLRILLTKPDTFSTYIAASPSIWWDKKVVLKDMDGFSARVGKGKVNLRLLVTVGGNETDSMKKNASAFVDNLSALKSATVTASLGTFSDENHMSSSLAGLGRALGFAFPVAGQSAELPEDSPPSEKAR